MDKIKVGLIGFGFSGDTFHGPIIPTVPELELVKVASSNPDKVQKHLPGVAVVATPEELLDDPEIELVIVTPPNTLHYPLTKLALQKGKHVVVEKPFVIHSADGVELIKLAEQQNRLLTVYQSRRWDGDFMTVKKLVQDGTLGQIYSYTASYERFRPEIKKRWREEAGPGSGILYDLGSHLIDQAVTLFGLPQTISADLQMQRQGAEAVDYFHLVLGYDKLRVILHSSCLVMQPGPHFQVHGTKGSFIKYGMDSQEDALKAGGKPGDPNWGEDDPALYGQLTTEENEAFVVQEIETVPGAYQNFYQQLAAAIRNNQPLPVVAQDSLNVIKIIELAEQSHQEGRVIEWKI